MLVQGRRLLPSDCARYLYIDIACIGCLLEVHSMQIHNSCMLELHNGADADWAMASRLESSCKTACPHTSLVAECMVLHCLVASHIAMRLVAAAFCGVMRDSHIFASSTVSLLATAAEMHCSCIHATRALLSRVTASPKLGSVCYKVRGL